MRAFLTRHPKLLPATVIAAFCAWLGAWLHNPASVPGSALVQSSYNSYYSWFDLADGSPTNAPVVIVYLDLESYLHEKLDPKKPWPRELHAQLLQRLQAAGARAVVFDVVFDTPGPNPAIDRSLADAMRAQGHVIIAGELSISSQSNGEGPWQRITERALPSKEFLSAAAAWGLGELKVDDDFVVRRYFPGFNGESENSPSLTWATARLFGLRTIQTNQAMAADRWIRYYGPPFTLPHVSFSRALAADPKTDSMFRDKIVFIGARPMAGLFKERRDEFRSPFHSWRQPDLFMPGVEVHATQMLNLIEGDWLVRLGQKQEAFALFLCGLLIGAGLLWLRPIPATVAAAVGSGAVLAIAVTLFRSANLWFPWLIVVGVQVPVALGGSILYQSISWFRARRQFEAAKRAAEARIREQAALIEKAHDAILVQRLDGRITYANVSAEKLFGWSRLELLDTADALFSNPSADAARRSTIERGEWNGELPQTSQSGRALTIESRWTLLRDESGQPSGLLIINSDITEKKQLEAEALRMQRMEAIGSLAGGMAHDLNNALAPVLMGTQLLHRDARDENARRILSLMESSTRRGADMVRQVLLFARGQQGDFERLDLRTLVKEMEKLARDTFPPNIAVSAQVADDLWPGRGNATQLHQVLLNLCINARDAMPNGGSLSLAADNVELSAAESHTIQDAHAGAFVVLIISDTGGGIPADVLPKIFDPFFTTKAEGQGTGLGLSTTARIVKAHGGFLRVESQVGDGTTFEVYLPRFAEASTPTAAASALELPQGHNELILVADDDEAVREMLRRSLEDHGYQVITAAHGAEAVSLFKQRANDVALLLSDRSMPVMDGLTAAKLIRSTRANLPVLFLSGDGELLDTSTGTVERMIGTKQLAKPIDLTSLLQAVADLVKEGKRTAGDENRA